MYCILWSHSSTNQVENNDGSGLILPGSHSLDDHLTMEPLSVPASVTTSEHHDQFMTPHDSSPSMHSLSSNCSQPTTPNGNNTAVENLSNEVITKPETEATQTGQVDDVIDTGVAFIKQQAASNGDSALISEANAVRRDDSGPTDDVIDSGFLLVDHPVDSTGEVDVEGTLKPTDLSTIATSSIAPVKRLTDYDYKDDEALDTLVPAHLRVVDFHSNNTLTKASMQVENRVVGLPISNNISINAEPSLLDSTLSERRKSATLPELKIAKTLPCGANSPEHYYTPTDSM